MPAAVALVQVEGDGEAGGDRGEHGILHLI
jgi:hypothetical protein